MRRASRTLSSRASELGALSSRASEASRGISSRAKRSLASLGMTYHSPSDAVPETHEEIHRLGGRRRRFRGVDADPRDVQSDADVGAEGRKRWNRPALVVELVTRGTDLPPAAG